MATIIESLIVTLGLDGAKFKAGSEAAKKQIKQTLEQTTTTAKQMEERGKQAARFFSSVKSEALSLLAVLTAGAGLKAFASSSITTSADVGRLASNLGMSTEALSAWQGAAARSGGTADAMAGTFRTVSGELAKFKMGLSSDFVAWFARANAAAGGTADAFNRLGSADSTMLELSRILSTIAATDPSKAMLFAKNLGVDESTFNFLKQGPGFVRAQIAAQMRLGVVTDADAKRAQEMQSKLEALRQASSKLGRDLLTKAAPAIEWLTDKLTQFGVAAQEHGPMVIGFFAAIALGVAAPYAGVLALTAVIGAVAVGIGYVYEQWQKWMSGSSSSLGAFFQFFVDIWNRIDGVFGPVFASAARSWVELFNVVVAGVKFVVALFSGSGAEIRESWKNLFASIGKLWDSEIEYLSKGIDLLKSFFPAIGDGIKAAFGAAFDWVVGRARAVWDAITGKKAAPVADGQNITARASVAPGAKVVPAPAATVAPAPAATGEVAQGPRAARPARGVRNNNPGNLNYVGQRGATKEAGPGGRFAVFGTMAEGVAALVTQIKLYASRGRDTITSIVNKYAPASDNNNVPAYIAALVKAMGVGANEHLNLSDEKTMLALVKGIVSHEQGRGQVPEEQINAGARLANTTARAGATTTTSTTSSDVKIGQVTIQTQATDAQGIARDAQEYFRQYPMIAPQANTGLN